jgi:hypothetical protein
MPRPLPRRQLMITDLALDRLWDTRNRRLDKAAVREAWAKILKRAAAARAAEARRARRQPEVRRAA